MSELYRIDRDGFIHYDTIEGPEGMLLSLKENGVLVLDDSLRQIADEFANATSTWLDIMKDWPDMYVLLNALVEGNEQ